MDDSYFVAYMAQFFSSLLTHRARKIVGRDQDTIHRNNKRDDEKMFLFTR